MKLQVIKTTRLVLEILTAAFTILIGILLYRVFMGYLPGTDVNQLFLSRLGMPAFRFLGISAGILIGLPVILIAFEIYARLSSAYIMIKTDKGNVLLSDQAISSFIRDSVGQMPGVSDLSVDIRIFKENRIGIHIWVDTDEKNDFLRFSERIQQRVLQDLEFNFSVNRIRYFNVYLESTNIDINAKGQKVEYK